MNFQYISDNKGNTTGVIIPISDWIKIKKKYKDIEEEKYDIPKWHQDIVADRLKDYEENPDSAIDFDSAMDEIEKEL